MKTTRWICVLAIAAVVLAMVQHSERKLSADNKPLQPAGEEVINFALIDHLGRLHELRRMSGKAVVLFFTANGCPVARLSASKMQDLADKFGDEGVQFYLVNSNS